MNLNIFFIIVSAGLLMIYFLFKPLSIKEQKFTDVPLFNIFSFTMYELNNKGLITLMSGTEATRYTNRYVVNLIDYTDNSKNYIANMKANSGIYKNEIVTLEGDVVYYREDGLTFETQKAVYNKKTSITNADGKYLLYQNSDRVIGTQLKYNNLLEQVSSKDVVAKYQLKEEHK
ncbi:LPS export ABC transporter periplasmic protein LptC [Candidatus Sulfurimonas marisnigri]|uniref:LPS export ABC transporter periplasmic protein LptC n=1 Tax=Candidatus Sulfurimonas marisnigri TaxID=2740405 RepID=A0A7S7RPH2_9BACT|nr:LPS export ABC transporter periplasmic protein LptC [Candidatus Sulfurimonas marisnigri]QOY53576.1 LPS export ABC transporter periplasmic protein LptC [Candidatus Sulfurimonas marisnigri]